jgi:hypothetical protein
MRVLVMLMATITISLTAFSNPVTDTSKICLPYGVGKRVAYDLVSYDSLKSQDSVTRTVLDSTKRLVVVDDSLISVYEYRDFITASMISTLREENKTCMDFSSKTVLQNRKLKSENKIVTVGALIIVSFAALFIGLHH